MPDVVGLHPLLQLHLGVALVAREVLPLGRQGPLQNEVGIVNLPQFFAPVRLVPPAEEATQVAVVHRGCHLHAAVALDAVEPLFVAPAVVLQGLLRPVAELHAAVAADDLVPLVPENLLRLGVQHPRP